MLKRLFAILLLVVATGTIPAASQSRYAWKDTYVTTSMNPVNNPRANDGIEVYTRPGALIVRCPERTNVIVMTILGQTISKATINAGTHELRIGTHGIYILKLTPLCASPYNNNHSTNCTFAASRGFASGFSSGYPTAIA